MMKILTGLILLLTLAACDLNPPKTPRLEGQWQCQNGMTLAFASPKKYMIASPAGESTGAYKLTVGESDRHRIEWLPDDKETPAPLPPRFRYFETGKLARLFFYTYVADEAVPCERRL